MTKLFNRVFASVPEDVKSDEDLSEKMSLLQQFIRPENLDIKPEYQNETSWLVLQINVFHYCVFVFRWMYCSSAR
jgi:Rab5 GDP/GTP exchange factor